MTTTDLVKLIKSVYIKDWDKYYSRSKLFQFIIQEMDMVSQELYILIKKENNPENRTQIEMKISELKKLGNDLHDSVRNI